MMDGGDGIIPDWADSICPRCCTASGLAPVDRDGNTYSHALPMQLLGSVDVNLARWTDGMGHAVVDSASGLPLAIGDTPGGYQPEAG